MIVRVSRAEAGLLARAARFFSGADDGFAAGFARTPGATACVAVHDNEIEGWCWGHLLARPDGPPMLYLHHLRVAEPHQGRGLGRALVRAFMDAGAEAGATHMFLTTGADNAVARRLYESLGAGLASQGPTVNYWFLLPASAAR
jgi:ribosomal protein S18 acetylase RimI-like enzyme